MLHAGDRKPEGKQSLPSRSLHSAEGPMVSLEAKDLGFGMVKRCTNKEDTQCQRCEEGFFSEGRIYYSCNPCTKCNVGWHDRFFLPRAAPSIPPANRWKQRRGHPLVFPKRVSALMLWLEGGFWPAAGSWDSASDPQDLPGGGRETAETRRSCPEPGEPLSRHRGVGRLPREDGPGTRGSVGGREGRRQAVVVVLGLGKVWQAHPSQQSQRFPSCCPGSGSRVWQRCNSSRDTVCQCTAGTQPVEAFKQGVECSRCPLGHFSPGGNTKCKPWTNCTALGKRTLRAGSSEADADCEDPDVPRPPRSPPTSPRTSTPGSSPTSASRAATQSLRPDPKPRPDRDLFPLSVIFLAALVLLVSGFILLLLIAFFCRRDKRLALCKLSGTNSCRMPIQEEHQPSLAKV
ncbi:tumor necrosis factor receptor superfamily member 4 [Monodelphis domestica]|uniref:tumor necrosis factor receptor superfamily member 4 n=1 Tax=Monodelphis domestica TaxID=13616 RepID=UPI0024E22738|nr:tumor necrosis factor receptor superfamily member 4 [Monodelphis domestica]